MKISVVVPVRNAITTIDRTMQSIWSQDYPDLEVVVMDGQSTDGTLEYLQSHQSRLHKLVSDRDGSSTAAINKSFQHTTGEVVMFLCADDYFASPSIVRRVAEEFAINPQLQMVSGALSVFDPGGVVETIKHISDPEQLPLRMSVYLGCTFFRRELFDLRKFDLRMKVADDYEFMAYLLYKQNARIKVIDEVFVRFALGGHSNRVQNGFAQARDCLYIRRTYFGGGPKAWLWFGLDMTVATLRVARIRPKTWRRQLQRRFGRRSPVVTQDA